MCDAAQGVVLDVALGVDKRRDTTCLDAASLREWMQNMAKGIDIQYSI